MSKPAPGLVRNPGTELHVEWLEDLVDDEPDLEARAAAIAEAAHTDGEVVERLQLAIAHLDLTTLSDTDTEQSVRDLCARAVRPVSGGRAGLHVAAVCVFDRFASVAREALEGHDVRVAAVTAGFPRPHDDLERRLSEIRAAVEAGADEIDVVITREHAIRGDWHALYEEVRVMRDACGSATLKAILVSGELGTLEAVARAGLVCSMAGADFIKSSTGREAVNATLPVGLAMSAAIRAYHRRTGHTVGLKAAGGIRTADQALSWLTLVRESLGPEWLTPARFRIGASSLLADVERRLRRETRLRGGSS